MMPDAFERRHIRQSGGMAITYASDYGTCSTMSYRELEDARRCMDTTTVALSYYDKPLEDTLFLRATDEVVNAPMQSAKNISPKRVAKRRTKNKAARKARRRNRKS